MWRGPSGALPHPPTHDREITREAKKTNRACMQVFSRAGEIRRLVMGLDRNQKKPCGFCFVEYALLHPHVLAFADGHWDSLLQVLHSQGCRGRAQVRQRHEIGRPHRPRRLGPGILRGSPVRPRQEWWSGTVWGGVGLLPFLTVRSPDS